MRICVHAVISPSEILKRQTESCLAPSRRNRCPPAQECSYFADRPPSSRLISQRSSPDLVASVALDRRLTPRVSAITTLCEIRGFRHGVGAQKSRTSIPKLANALTTLPSMRLSSGQLKFFEIDACPKPPLSPPRFRLACRLYEDGSKAPAADIQTYHFASVSCVRIISKSSSRV